MNEPPSCFCSRNCPWIKLSFGNKWRLAVNPSKCEVAVFGYTGSRQPHILLTIANTTVQQNKGCKYLGVILSPRLSWDQHLNLVSSKIKWRIGALRVMGRRYRNLESLWIQLVGTYIIAVIRYAAPAWFPFINDTCKKRLIRFQCEALCSALGRSSLTSEDDARTILEQCGNPDILEILHQQCINHWTRSSQINSNMRNYIKTKAPYILEKLPKLFKFCCISPISE